MIPTPFLIWWRAAFIGLAMLAMVTVEPVFEAVETELERRGVPLE